ncbi:hypothetical protein FRB93_009064 [Tulasnella sp. JGI-2019a]|nr:hypothetical protein FRB93_009064 [Tulasnella sp. JGI-2019a]
MAWRQIDETVSSNQIEVVQRHGVDNILWLALRSRLDTSCKTPADFAPESFEARMQLADAGPRLTKYPQPVATVDALVTTTPKFSYYGDVFQAMVDAGKPVTSNPFEEARWQCRSNTDFSLILFAIEYKRVDGTEEGNMNPKQLVVTFVTAQKQRRAIGLPDEFIFGVECTHGVFKIGASWWGAGNSIRYALNIFTLELRRPIELLQAYHFLCYLDEHLSKLTKQLVDQPTKDIVVSLGKPGSQWRAPPEGPKPTSKKRPRLSDSRENAGGEEPIDDDAGNLESSSDTSDEMIPDGSENIPWSRLEKSIDGSVKVLQWISAPSKAVAGETVMRAGDAAKARGDAVNADLPAAASGSEIVS